jgi:hypothetical protein
MSLEAHCIPYGCHSRVDECRQALAQNLERAPCVIRREGQQKAARDRLELVVVCRLCSGLRAHVVIERTDDAEPDAAPHDSACEKTSCVESDPLTALPYVPAGAPFLICILDGEGEETQSLYSDILVRK